MNKRSKVKNLSGLLTAVTFAAALGAGLLQPEAAEAVCRDLSFIDGPCDWYMIAPSCETPTIAGVWDHFQDDHTGLYCYDDPADTRTSNNGQWSVWEDIDDTADPLIDTTVKLGPDDPILVGEGYWMCITESPCIDTTWCATSPTPMEDCSVYGGSGNCFAVDVEETPDSFDMIGHPFAYTVAWNTVQVACDTTGGGAWTVLGSPADAETANVMSESYYTYNGNTYDVYTETGGPLEPLTGYWIYTLPNFSTTCPGGVKLLILP
jgi:hypothetical protein